MSPITRRRALAAGTAALAAPWAHAQSAWPAKPVNIVVPFPPGGGTDAFARPLFALMSKNAGKQFIIGSLKGGDEYALEELNAYGDPEQLLVGCHEKTGVSWRYPLYVKHGDETPSRYEALL